MESNAAMGVALHAVGGLAAGSFYAPLKKVQGWAWESSWLAMGLAAWMFAPWLVAWLTIPDLLGVLAESWRDSPGTWLAAVGFGLLWGVGNLAFGLSIRYLGMALGYAIALGACMGFGTLLPPIVEGRLAGMLQTFDGAVVFSGALLGLVGVGMCGIAGRRREAEQASDDVTERSNGSSSKGIAVALVAGLLSACFAFGLTAGKPIADAAVNRGAAPLYANNAVLVVILIGGFVSNAAWCCWLLTKNRTWTDYRPLTNNWMRNVALALVAGVIWFGQFFFYGMGSTKLGETYDFASWSIHMAFIIVFSSFWGLLFREWRGVGGVTMAWVYAGLLGLVGSTIVIGWGSALAG